MLCCTLLTTNAVGVLRPCRWWRACVTVGATIGDQVWSPEDSMRMNSTLIINNIMIIDYHCMITCAQQLMIKFANSTMFMILDCKMMDITVKYKYTWSSLALSRIGRTPSMNTAAAKNPNKAPEILKSHEWLQKRGQPSLLRNEILNFITY